MTDQDRPAQKDDSATGANQRLWRMRRRDHVVDAEICPVGSEGVELRYSYNGEVTYRRVWVSRALAVQDAAARRAELERGGWVFHW
jgi:hypothetical protein